MHFPIIWKRTHSGAARVLLFFLGQHLVQDLGPVFRSWGAIFEKIEVVDASIDQPGRVGLRVDVVFAWVVKPVDVVARFVGRLVPVATAFALDFLGGDAAVAAGLGFCARCSTGSSIASVSPYSTVVICAFALDESRFTMSARSSSDSSSLVICRRIPAWRGRYCTKIWFRNFCRIGISRVGSLRTVAIVSDRVYSAVPACR